MSSTYENAPFKINKAAQQFEMEIEGATAFIEFSAKDDKVYLTHTEVPEALNGKGIGSTLVKKTLQYIKDNQLTVVPSCSFVAHYIDTHPEWHSLLSEGYQM